KKAALNCNEEFSFALVRPPGHHAGRNFFAGFCYINNIAFATRALQKKEKGKKVMIIDIDFHFGNGTWDIFYDDKTVFYISFHCDPTFAYPGTGFEDENTDHMINVTLKPNTSDEEYVEKFRENVTKYFKIFNPSYIGVSVGFDTYYLDPIAGLNIKNLKTYRKIGEIIKELKKPTFCVLEGGYYLQHLGEIFLNFIDPFL
ncbi:MAG: histone deacetylase, partial [Candidatus Micrarchaeia archaeon]